jgi:hypothetical protein
LLSIAEKNYYSEKFKLMAGNIRETWKLIGSLLNNNQQNEISNFFVIDGIEITNKQKIVDKFNDYFVSIGSRLASAVPDSAASFKDYLKLPNLDTFSLVQTTSTEIIDIVTKLKNKWSSGFDNIPVNLLKMSIIYIAYPISQLINCSFNAGIFPESLKFAKVCPIYKTGEKTCFSNYRPISILPSFSKIFEKAVFNRFMSFLEINNVLIKNQYGFRQNYSTYMALMEMYDKISFAIDNGKFAIGIFIDLLKAFDTLNHNILSNKLQYYGVRGAALDWFRSYLTNRKQCVYLNGVYSSFKPIDCGVPQGSILGPLLFILYINNIIACSSVLNLILFADDTNLFYSNANICELVKIVNEELLKLSDWFRANKLSLNAKKTSFMMFGNKHILNDQLLFKLDGCILERTPCTKFLGVYLDEKLKWTQHLIHIAAKISRGLGVMGRMRKILPQNVVSTLYFSLIYPYLIYCCVIWGGASATALHKLEVLQNRAVRIITLSPFRSSASPLYKQLLLLKFCDIRKLQIVQFMFRCQHSLLPESCLHYCRINPQQSYYMRQTHYFATESFRTTIREQCINIQGPKIWDSLPVPLLAVTNLVMLKHNVSRYMIASY